MSVIGRFFWHLFQGMVKGFFIMLIAALIVCAVANVALTHSHAVVPSGLALALEVVVVALSGLLGAAAMLAWRLSHISELTHATGHLVERMEAEHRR